MIDQISLDRIAKLHPKVREEARLIYLEASIALTGTSGLRIVQGFRTIAEQDALFAQGRSKPGPIVTQAKGIQSYHCWGLAVDFCLLNDKNQDGKISADEIVWNRDVDLDKDQLKDWMEVVKVFTKYGWQWGASFGDYPHFEKKFGKTWRDFSKLKDTGMVDKDGYVLI